MICKNIYLKLYFKIVSRYKSILYKIFKVGDYLERAINFNLGKKHNRMIENMVQEKYSSH